MVGGWCYLSTVTRSFEAHSWSLSHLMFTTQCKAMTQGMYVGTTYNVQRAMCVVSCVMCRCVWPLGSLYPLGQCSEEL